MALLAENSVEQRNDCLKRSNFLDSRLQTIKH
jgi:hypothetical protein